MLLETVGGKEVVELHSVSIRLVVDVNVEVAGD